MKRPISLLPLLLGSLLVGCVDLTPMWEKNLDSAVVPGKGGSVAPGAGGDPVVSTGGIVGTGGIVAEGGIVAAGGEVAETGGSPVASTGGALVGDGGPSTGGTLGVDAAVEAGGSEVNPSTGGMGAGGVIATGGRLATGGAIATGGEGGTGGAASTGGTTVDSGRRDADPDAALDFPVDLTRDTAIDLPVDLPVDRPPVDAPVNLNPIVLYSCESATGDQLADSSGNNRLATLVGPYTFTTGKVGNALVLGAPATVDGGVPASYVTLPSNVFISVNDMTIAVWINLNSNSSWNRVFDFGTGRTSYMFLTPKITSTNGLRFGITISGNGAEQRLDGPTVPLGTWTHLAVVIDGSGGRLFVNGTQAAVNTAMTLRPSSIGEMPNAWIGRSQFVGGGYTDPFFDGLIDDFRIYDRALAPSEITTLATP